MLLEADLVGVIWIGLVAVDGLRAVGILDGGFLLSLVVLYLGGDTAEGWGGRVAGVCASGAPGVTGHGRGGLEAVELGGCVHLGGGALGFRTVRVAVGNWSGRARAWVLLVKGIRIDKSAVAGLWLRSVVEDPDNLDNVSGGQ